MRVCDSAAYYLRAYSDETPVVPFITYQAASGHIKE